MTAYLADACALVEFHAPSPRTMTPDVLDIMAGDAIHVAGVTVWEILRKVGIGKLPLPAPRNFSARYPDWLREKGDSSCRSTGRMPPWLPPCPNTTRIPWTAS